jgi:hypothetical protein
LVAAGWAYRLGEPDSGFNESVESGVAYNAGCSVVASRLAPWPVPLRCHHGSCLDVPVVGDARGYVVYADPSYKNTTGYAENIYAVDLGRWQNAPSQHVDGFVECRAVTHEVRDRGGDLDCVHVAPLRCHYLSPSMISVTMKSPY